MAGKFYAVRVGAVPGIYLSWAECEAQTKGYSGAVYKSFTTRVEAEAFMYMGGSQKAACDAAEKHEKSMRQPAVETADRGRAEKTSEAEKAAEIVKETEETDGKHPYAFVDGSFNTSTKVYGYGGFLVHDGMREKLQGCGDDPQMASMRNVAGEVCGSMAAIKRAVELGLAELTIYYDYMGIEMWANGTWKRNKDGTIKYHDYVQSVKNRIRLSFVKVKGHSGVEGNEEADRLAKQAVGIETVKH